MLARRGSALLLLALLLFGGLVSVSAATPPRPGTEGNGLTENESATLWSRDNDSRYITNAAYRKAYGENRTAVQQAANGTDLTFKRPPATAATWTRNDLIDYRPGNASVSVYPTTANLTDSTLIRDAHATIFGVTPSTVVHTGPGQTTRYIAPSGTVVGAVDYRIGVPRTTILSAPPNGTENRYNRSGNRTPRQVSWSLWRHNITSVRLLHDGRVIAETNGTHRPRLDYAVRGRDGNLTLKADIRVRLNRTVSLTRVTNRTGQNGSRQRVPLRTLNATVVNDSVTATDHLSTTVYDLDPSLQYARYPDGDLGIAVAQHLPWQGYRLRGRDRVRVRGVWRFYTARNPNWDLLVHARANGTVRKESDALPVAVHAYPSRIGPRLEPSGRGAKLLERWGEPKASPAGTLGEDVIVEVVEEEYEPTYGLAARYRGNASTPVTVRGIVRGVDRTLRPTTDGQLRELRRSNLTVERLSENESGVTYRIRLRDAKTGAPIAMSAPENPRYRPILVDEPDATLTVGDRRVRTNLSGMTTVRINESGVYTVRYDAESWLIHDPAYTDAATTVRWHPLATVAGWLSFGVRVVLWFLPFAVALYAGRRLGGLLRYRGEL